MADMVIAKVEETVNHLKNVHDGPGFFTGKRRQCSSHTCKKTPKCTNEERRVCSCTPIKEHESTTYNDCKDFQKDMEAYLTKKICANISHVVHPTKGVLTQNASERVGMVALMYRDKVRRLGPTHYKMSTNFAIAHVNSIVIAKFRRQLADHEGIGDPEAASWECGWRGKLVESMGMQPCLTTLQAWTVDLRYRMKHSSKRQTGDFTKARIASKKKLKERRNAERKDAGATYKDGERAGAAGAGAAGGGSADDAAADPGYCECRGACATRKCVCRVAGRMSGANCRGCVAKCERRGGAGAAARPARHGAVREPPQDIGAGLVGLTIEFHWPRYGWLRGEVVEHFDDDEGEDMPDGTPATHAVQYDGDPEPSCHVLYLEDYDASVGAKKGSWSLWKEPSGAGPSGAGGSAGALALRS
eukprot:3162637-Prymnesium_polylepis.1